MDVRRYTVHRFVSFPNNSAHIGKCTAFACVCVCVDGKFRENSSLCSKIPFHSAASAPSWRWVCQCSFNVYTAQTCHLRTSLENLNRFEKWMDESRSANRTQSMRSAPHSSFAWIRLKREENIWMKFNIFAATELFYPVSWNPHITTGDLCNWLYITVGFPSVFIYFCGKTAANQISATFSYHSNILGIRGTFMRLIFWLNFVFRRITIERLRQNYKQNIFLRKISKPLHT